MMTVSGGRGSQNCHCACSLPIAQILDIRTLRSALIASVDRGCKHIICSQISMSIFTKLPSVTGALLESVTSLSSVRGILLNPTCLREDILRTASRFATTTAYANGTLLRSQTTTAFFMGIVRWPKIATPVPQGANLAREGSMVKKETASSNVLLGSIKWQVDQEVLST